MDALLPQLAANQTTSQALTEAALDRAQQGEGPRVFTRLFAAQAMAEARASDALRAVGLARSAIEGVPVSVKDLFDVAGHVTTAGSRLLAGAEPAAVSADIVQRLRRAGAVIVGCTNMTEFAYSGLGINPHYGTPRNPWGRSDIGGANSGGRIPGGSSSGAAVSVSDGMAVAAIGTDTGGSVRIPAALCGLVGFKPTARRIPSQGLVPLSFSLDSIGPMADSVSTCAVLDDVLSGASSEKLQAMPLAGLRFFAPENVVLDGMDDTVAAAWDAALHRLSQAGARIVRGRMAALDDLAGLQSQGGLAAAESWAWHRRFLPEQRAAYDPRVLSRIERGAAISAADYIDLLGRRRHWIAQVSAQLAPYDALIMPTVPVVAPDIAALEASDAAYFAANALILRNPSVINFLDGCAISIPCHRPGEAPVGFSLAAPGGQDRRLLAVALAVEGLLKAG